ncbi:MAG: hypothetical protein DSY47_05720 [Hydrogenothermus sp.]|nr:MAG: hypothetical protein DSY47_05720 [Hydrogenothermus sp.]
MKLKIIISFLTAIFIYGCDSSNRIWKIFEEEDLLKHPKALRCADCHQDIYHQWKNSRHSLAYISEDYKKATNNYSKTKCLNCHIPLELSKGETPQFRNFYKEDGVSCVSCHFSSGTNSMHGPYKVFSPPHPSTKDVDFRKSFICSSCHKETYKQWKLTKVKKTCQECHMKPIEKKDLIQKFPFQYFHLAKEVYNHQFKTGKIKNLKITAKKIDNTLILSILNNQVPHNFPTADNGKPKVYILVEVFKNNQKVEEDNTLITPKFSLIYGKPKILEFDFFDEFDFAKVSVYRKLSWQKEKEKILEKTFSFK